MEDYRFYAGDQDTDEVKAALSSLNRPASVFNEVKPKIDMLIGFRSMGIRIALVLMSRVNRPTGRSLIG